MTNKFLGIAVTSETFFRNSTGGSIVIDQHGEFWNLPPRVQIRILTEYYKSIDRIVLCKDVERFHYLQKYMYCFDSLRIAVELNETDELMLLEFINLPDISEDENELFNFASDILNIKNELRSPRDTVRSASKKLRQLIETRDSGRCRYCGKEVSGKDACIDHVIPWRRGGKTSVDNLVLCCKKCNSKKSAYKPHEVGMELLPAN